MNLHLSPILSDELEEQARVRAEMPETDPAHAEGKALRKALFRSRYSETMLNPEEVVLARKALASSLDDIGDTFGLNLHPSVKRAARSTLAKMQQAFTR